MTEILWKDKGELRRPMMLCAFSGLFDAGRAATDALDRVKGLSESGLMAEIDPDRFVDFSNTRPHVRFSETGGRLIDWPTVRLWGCKTEGPRDLIVVTGPEPHLRWGSFSSLLTEVVWKTGTEMVITVGAAPAVVAHSRELRVTGSTADVALASHLGLNQPTYEGPTGIIGVINAGFEAKHIPVISLRVDVPHYVPGAPSPKATQSLLKRIEGVTGVKTGWSDLEGEVEEWILRVEVAVESDTESHDYVRKLEEQSDRYSALDGQPSDIGDEVEEFLKGLRPDEE